MLARFALAILVSLLVQPVTAATIIVPITPFGGIPLTCVIKPSSYGTSYLGLSNPTAGTIAAGTQILIKTDHSAPFTVVLSTALPPGGNWSKSNVPVSAKHCTARTATLAMQLPQQQTAP